MQKTVVDNKKRLFLRLAGIAGIGAVASLLLPKKTEAIVFGSTPASSVVGIKDSSNNLIDSSTEVKQDEILEELKLKADLTETQPVSGVIGISDSVGTRINAATNDSVVLWRRMVKLMESQATVDAANRQRVTVDAWSENISVLLDTGTAAGTQNPTALVDTTKYTTWVENQWSYYAVKITGGTGVGQIRLITGNTSTVLTLQDAWTVQPDGTSTYGIYGIAFVASDYGVVTGGQGLNALTDTSKTWADNIWTNYAVRIADSSGATQIRLISGNTATVLTYQGPWTVPLGINPNLDSGIAIGEQNLAIFTDTSKTWADNTWINYVVIITSGTGENQAQVISSNTSTVLSLQNSWVVQPDATSTYAIRAMPTDANDSGTATGEQANNALVDNSKNWADNVWTNYAVKITSGTGASQVRQISSNTTTYLTLSADWATQPDATSTYAIYSIPSSQTYSICVVPTLLTDLGTSASCPRATLSSDSGPIVGFYAAQQKFGDISHKVYNDSIRSQLTFN